MLIVDDDAATRVGLDELLTAAGYETRALASFEQGLRALRTDPPDLLIADVRLGAFNGLQLLVSSPRQIPSIIITGFADPVLESDARQHGAEYVLKPVQPAALLELVQRKLSDQKTASYDIKRRWERKQVLGGLEARIQDQPARILDVSYGGIRFELPRLPEQHVPSSLSIRLPTPDLSIRADVVWQSPADEEHWICGAIVSQPSPSIAREWRGFVDAVKAS